MEQGEFLEKKRFPLNLLNQFLVCGICDGYFRFAHTITECGHTFCKICIHDYISKTQNAKSRKQCPSCKSDLEVHLSKSIKRDPYKQQMVDLLYPQFAKEEQLIVKRVKEIFPRIDLEFLLEEFNYENMSQQYGQRKKKETNDSKVNVKHVIEYYLQISFDKFLHDLYDETNFAKMKATLISKHPELYEPLVPGDNNQAIIEQQSQNNASLTKSVNEKRHHHMSSRSNSQATGIERQTSEKKRKISEHNNNNNASPQKQNEVAQQSPPTQAISTQGQLPAGKASVEQSSEIEPRFEQVHKRYPNISGAALQRLSSELSESVFRFFVYPRTPQDYEVSNISSIFNLTRVPGRLYTVSHVKNKIIESIKGEKKSVNIYFNDKLQPNNTLLIDIQNQTGNGVLFILEFEIV